MTFDISTVDLNKNYVYITKEGELAATGKGWLGRLIIRVAGGDRNMEHVVQTVRRLREGTPEGGTLPENFKNYIGQQAAQGRNEEVRALFTAIGETFHSSDVKVAATDEQKIELLKRFSIKDQTLSSLQTSSTS